MAVQTLYAMEITQDPVHKVVPGIIESLDPKEEQKKFGMDLIDSVLEHKDELNETISGLSKNWDFERISVLDKVILQVAILELKFRKNTPPKVAIAEATAISAKYSTDKSSSFVNGILAQVGKELFKD